MLIASSFFFFEVKRDCLAHDEEKLEREPVVFAVHTRTLANTIGRKQSTSVARRRDDSL